MQGITIEMLTEDAELSPTYISEVARGDDFTDALAGAPYEWI
jgi:hypothetical protein